MCRKGLPWCAHVGSLFQMVSNVKSPAGNCHKLQMELVFPVTQHSCPSRVCPPNPPQPTLPISSAMHPLLCPSSHSASRSVQDFCLCVNSTSCWPLNDLQSNFSILSSPALSPWITQQKWLLQLEIDGKSWGFLSGNYAGYQRCPMTTGGRCDLGVSVCRMHPAPQRPGLPLGQGIKSGNFLALLPLPSLDVHSLPSYFSPAVGSQRHWMILIWLFQFCCIPVRSTTITADPLAWSVA